MRCIVGERKRAVKEIERELRSLEFHTLLMLRSSGFHGSPYAKEVRIPGLCLC